MKIIQHIFIDSAHQLPDTPDLVTKKCCNLHGHTYKITLEFDGEVAQSGLLVDFSKTKEIVNELDHQYINDIFQKHIMWQSKSTTAENIAKFIHERICEKIKLNTLKVIVVEGYKGPDSPQVIYEN